MGNMIHSQNQNFNTFIKREISRLWTLRRDVFEMSAARHRKLSVHSVSTSYVLTLPSRLDRFLKIRARDQPGNSVVKRNFIVECTTQSDDKTSWKCSKMSQNLSNPNFCMLVARPDNPSSEKALGNQLDTDETNPVWVVGKVIWVVGPWCEHPKFHDLLFFEVSKKSTDQFDGLSRFSGLSDSTRASIYFKNHDNLI